jgi:hypothetical protein
MSAMAKLEEEERARAEGGEEAGTLLADYSLY